MVSVAMPPSEGLQVDQDDRVFLVNDGFVVVAGAFCYVPSARAVNERPVAWAATPLAADHIIKTCTIRF